MVASPTSAYTRTENCTASGGSTGRTGSSLLSVLTAEEASWNGEWTICTDANWYKGLGVPGMNEADLRTQLRIHLRADAQITLSDEEANANIKWTTLKRVKIFPLP
jgi:hypothetical protein